MNKFGKIENEFDAKKMFNEFARGIPVSISYQFIQSLEPNNSKSYNPDLPNQPIASGETYLNGYWTASNFLGQTLCQINMNSRVFWQEGKQTLLIRNSTARTDAFFWTIANNGQPTMEAFNQNGDVYGYHGVSYFFQFQFPVLSWLAGGDIQNVTGHVEAAYFFPQPINQ